MRDDDLNRSRPESTVERVAHLGEATSRGLEPALGEVLAGAVGRAHVLTDPDVVATYEVDWTGRWRGRAACVVRPASTAEVAAVLRACCAAGARVVPQGGNTGLVGGSVPRRGEIVLSLRRLDRVDPVDRQAGAVVAAAGATLAAVQTAAEEAGFAFGVDIAPRASCTIGGMIATNAGGVHVIRHGMMASQVIGVEAVLADGRIVGRVPGLHKDNAGYHLSALLAGSEGTLAVITRAHLRLVAPRPERAAALIAVADASAAMEVVAFLRVRLPSLVAAEILFAEAIALQCRHADASPPLARIGGAVLLIECAGTSSPLDELADGIAALGPLALETAIASDAAAVARLWRIRDGVPEAIRAGGIAHKIDVALPLERVPEFERRVRKLVGDLAPTAELILFGHAGDGNLHVNVLGLAPEDDTVDEAILRLVAELGGSIAAEHGVGVAKVAALAAMGNPADLAAMRAVKRALDPSGLLNPGVVLADESARPD